MPKKGLTGGVPSLPLTAQSWTSATHSSANWSEQCSSALSSDSFAASTTALWQVCFIIITIIIIIKYYYSTVGFLWNHHVDFPTEVDTYTKYNKTANMNTFTYLVERAWWRVSPLYLFHTIAWTVSMSTRAVVSKRMWLCGKLKSNLRREQILN